MTEPQTCPTCWLPIRRRGANCPICRAPLDGVSAEEPIAPSRRRREQREPPPGKDVMGLPLMLFVAGVVVVVLAFVGLMLFGVALAIVKG